MNSIQMYAEFGRIGDELRRTREEIAKVLILLEQVLMERNEQANQNSTGTL